MKFLKVIKIRNLELQQNYNRPPNQVGPKKSGPQSGRKQKRKTEKPTSAEELAGSDESSEEGEIGKYHLSQPKAVFRHIQSLASKHGELRNGELNTYFNTLNNIRDVVIEIQVLK